MSVPLADQTEACLAGVLNLCTSITQEDVDAVQRHDEAALALLDVNDDDAMEVSGVLCMISYRDTMCRGRGWGAVWQEGRQI